MEEIATVETQSISGSVSASASNGMENSSVSSGSNYSGSGNDDFFFGKYSRHVPRILRHQIISKLVNQYIYKIKTTDDTSHANRVNSKQGDPVLSQKLKVDDLKNQINAYFQKIVDIINKYDGEIIKFAGDALFIIWQTKVNVTNDPRFLAASKDAADKAVTCGVEINTECSNYAIALKNSNGDSKKVNDLIQSMNTNHGMFEGSRLPQQPEKPTSPRSPKNKKKRREPTVTYLNVHAGVSMGVMAGMDVGANDRFEYLLLGRPMNDVAIAEGDAGTGEIVISPAVHDLLHNYASLKATGSHSGRTKPADTVEGDGAPPASPHPLSCGCTRTASGFYKIRSTLDDMLCAVDFGASTVVDPTAATPAICVVPAAEEFEGNGDLQYEFEVYAHVIEELMAGYKAISPALMTQFAGILQSLSAIPDDEKKGGEESATELTRVTSPDGRRAAIEYTEKEVMMEHFFSWAQHCLLDDIAKHVHEVVRKGYSFYQENRAAPFEHFLSSPTCIENFRAQLERTQGVTHRNSTTRHVSALTTGSPSHSASETGSAHSSVSSHSGSASASNSRSQPTHHSGHHSSHSGHSGHHHSSGGAGSRTNGDSFVSKMRQLTGLSTLREKKQNKHQQVLSKDGALVSELRNVIVLFISVKIGNASVFIDPQHTEQTESRAAGTASEHTPMIQTCKVDTFHFLSRTVDEIEADKKLINQFQSCMEVMTGVFHDKGGQMRQFIVDDKGTVCIGTFGLRGSVNYDNGAAAIDAADLIVERLQALGFNASVGVTSGAAYCGLVGSNTRHEYAVMGPSTNLSARLMGRAQVGEIICDSAIRQRDRAHTYTSLGAVKAKGYTNLVPIFKPEFIINTALQDNQPTASAAPVLALKQPSKLKTDPVSAGLSEVYGRKKEAVDMFKFLFHDAVKGGLDELSDAFWKPVGVESMHKTVDLLHELAPYEEDTKAQSSKKSQSSSKKRRFAFTQAVRKVRFDPTRKMKKNVVISPNGLGKTALLNLFQYKLNALVRKNAEVYNIVVFRHQVGYINTTTIFSAWYCLVRQTLFSIAETVAEGGDPQAVQCLEAIQKDDCTPIVDFLCDYLPAELRPFTPLLSLVGIKLLAKPSQPPLTTVGGIASAQITAAEEVMSDSEGKFGDTDIESPDGSPPDSGKTDPVSTLDPAEKLQRCAEIVVAIVQLHVKLTRKVTVYIMDDLQQHDPASQDLGRLLARTVTGICVICTYRTSQTFNALSGDPAQTPGASSLSSQPKVPARLFDGAAFTSNEAAMQALPQGNEFRRTELRPLTKVACKQLLSKIFSNFGVANMPDEVLDTLHSLSAGSPLYATELAKTVCDRYIRRACTMGEQIKGLPSQLGQPNQLIHVNGEASSNVPCTVQLNAIIDDLRTDRIEEIVHFRFDKLTEQCQLVLKMAAVASVSGSHFTLSMLTYIIDSSDNSESAKLDAMIHNTKALLGYTSDGDDDFQNSAQHRVNPLHNSMDLVQAINDLLESDEFIEFRGDLSVPARGDDEEKSSEGGGSSYRALLQLNATTPVTPKPDLNQLMNETNHHVRANSRDRSALQQLRFHWKVDMELRAIYDLMLDEQKESLHDRVASYLEQNLEKSDEISATEWAQQGFHWERATNWGSAMTCYYQAGMILKDQGDSQGCKSCFTEAFRMLDKMRQDAGIPFLEGPSALRPTTEPDLPAMSPPAIASCAIPAVNSSPIVLRTEEDMRQMAVASMEYILCGRNSGLTAENIYKMFEGSSQLFTTGMSVLVRLAQTLIGPGTTDLSYRLFEDTMDMVHILKASATVLIATDGEPFSLVDKELCFPTISGMFLLLLNDQVADINKNSRLVALVSIAMQLAKSKPEYEVHLVHAYISKIRLLERFLHQDPTIVPHIISYSDELIRLYQRDKHSKALIHFYNSDRVPNALGVVVKVLCMQGRFAESLKYLEVTKHLAGKIKRFFSQAMGVVGYYAPMMLYFPDTQAQFIFEKFMQDTFTKQSKEFQEVSPMLLEGIAQVLKLAQFEANRDENIFDSDSSGVEGMIQSRVLVQAHEVKFVLNMMRLYNVAFEFVAARICYLKALHCDMLQHSDSQRATQHRAKAVSYLQLGLEHLTFLPEQSTRNEVYVFSNLHEKLLRAQLLMKSVEYCDDSAYTGNGVSAAASDTDGQTSVSTQSKAQLWQQALENLQYCAAVGKRGDFHGILLQAGAHMVTLSDLPVHSPSDGVMNSANATLPNEEVRSAIRADGKAIYEAAVLSIKQYNGSSVNLDAIFSAMMIKVPPVA